MAPRCAIKFDISKAFDTVKWSFISKVLLAMGLPLQFIHWVFLCISTASFSVAINGSLEGFFTSARGIRQGCSLSPYLYVILNNVLSRMLNLGAEAGEFDYHPQCRELKLTHLSFADDIMVFTKGSTDSLQGVLAIMQRFAKISGLHINVSKSSIFVSGRNINSVVSMAESLNIGVGTLPVRYLGMPLTTKTLAPNDYEPLIDNIRGRLLCWSNKMLSFAGRLQLIKSVVSGVVNFWCSAFILPAKCLHTIEKMCTAFIWSGSPTQTHRAKVCWDDISCPKEEGGLGVRKLREVNKVLALKLIWRLFSQPSSLWVSWVNTYLLKNSSFWDAGIGHRGSWMWRKLLKMRDVAYKFINIDIKDGKSCFFWFDDWLGKGKLIDITGPAGPTLMGILRSARVCDAASPAGWKIQERRNRGFPDLHAAILDKEHPKQTNGGDVVLWKHGTDDYRSTFTALSTWNQIRVTNSRVDWNTVVWFSQGVPRFSFITWLAILNRLSTGDRTRQWGQLQGCVFCGERDETRDHLFFACPYTFTVWEGLVRRLAEGNLNPDWAITLQHLQRLPARGLDSILMKMAFQTTIYYIWQERNARRHQQRTKTREHLHCTIERMVRNRISSLKYGNGHKCEGLLRRWFQVTT